MCSCKTYYNYIEKYIIIIIRCIDDIKFFAKSIILGTNY